MALAGRAAVVTGGASGIGRATSLMLKKLGATVMVHILVEVASQHTEPRSGSRLVPRFKRDLAGGLV